MGLGFIKDIGKSAVNVVKKAPSAAVNAVKSAPSAAVEVAKRAPSAALDVAKKVPGKAVEIAKRAPGDVVNFSKEALEFKAKQENNFAQGVLTWGKDTVGTVAGIVSHPIESAKAVDKLASNPVINPIGGTARALIQGKNPVEAYKDGANDLKDLGSGLLDGYKDVYKEHGIAGLAGNLAPDIAIAIASGGSGTAARGAAQVGGRTVAKEVAEAGGRTVAREVAESGGRNAIKEVAKDIGKEFIPGPEDIVDVVRDQNQPKDAQPNFIQALIDAYT